MLQDLMYEETSNIIDFYPQDFELDMNGKKQDWEAVVKIPFIDQQRLLRAMTRALSACLFVFSTLTNSTPVFSPRRPLDGRGKGEEPIWRLIDPICI